MAQVPLRVSDTCSSPTSSHLHTKADDSATWSSLLVAIPLNVHLRYFATFCICAGTSANVALVLTWCAWHHRLHGRASYLTFRSCSLPQPRLGDEEGSRHAAVHVHRPLREHTGIPPVSDDGCAALRVGIFAGSYVKENMNRTHLQQERIRRHLRLAISLGLDRECLRRKCSDPHICPECFKRLITPRRYTSR